MSAQMRAALSKALEAIERAQHRGPLDELEMEAIRLGRAALAASAPASEPSERKEQQRHVFALRVVDAAVEACRMQILGTAALPEYSRGIRHCLALLRHLDRRAVVTKVLKAEQQPPTMQATQLRHLPQPGEYNARVQVSVEGAVLNIEVLEFIKS